MNEETKKILLTIGFVEAEIQFFTESKAQEVIRNYKQKLKLTKDPKKCSVLLGTY